MNYSYGSGNRFRPIKIKKQSLIYFFLFIIYILLVYNYCDGDDYSAYFADYYRLMRDRDAVISRNYEDLFRIAMVLFSSFKISFKSFYTFLMATGLLVMIKFYKNNIKEPVFLLLITFVYPYYIYLQQIRSFMAISVILLGVDYLVHSSDSKRKKAVKYVLMCLVASLFQQTSLFYTVLIFSIILRKETIKKVIVILEVLIPMTLFATYGYIISLLRLITHDHWMIDFYLPKNFTVQKYTVYIVGIFVVFLLVLFLLDKRCGKRQDLFDKDYIMYNCALIVCGLSMICYFTVIMDRIVVMLVPVVYVTIYRISRENYRRLSGMVCRFACVVFVVFSLVFTIGPWNSQMHDRVFNDMWRKQPKIEEVQMIYR